MKRSLRVVARLAAVLATVGAPACSKQTPATDTKVAAAAADKSPVETHGRRIDIHVSKQGFDPDHLALKAKEPVTLVFTRLEPTECGSQVVIASLNVKKDLPLNIPIAVDYTPEKSGEVPFSCGMGMMHGTLLVGE